MSWAQQRREEAHHQTRELLLELLSQRFDPLSEDLVERVRKADAAQIFTWFDRILSASSAREVLDLDAPTA